jgi:hypothetical protein
MDSKQVGGTAIFVLMDLSVGSNFYLRDNTLAAKSAAPSMETQRFRRVGRTKASAATNTQVTEVEGVDI